MEKSIKSSGLNYGIYLGIVLTLITVVVYALNTELFTKWWLGIITFLIIIIFGIIASVKARGLLGGFISFKNAFASYFITIAVGTLISTIIGILIFNIIDPEAAEFINEKIIEMTGETMEKFGAPEASIDEAMEKMQDQDNFSIAAQLKSFVFRLAFMSIFGLIVALAVKKTDPNAA